MAVWTKADIATQIEAIETVISGRITADLQNYTIGNRQITKIPIEELLVMRDKLKREYNTLDAAEQVAAGTGNPNKVLTRF